MRRAPAWIHLISELNTNAIGESRGGWRLSPGALLPAKRGWITDDPFKEPTPLSLQAHTTTFHTANNDYLIRVFPVTKGQHIARLQPLPAPERSTLNPKPSTLNPQP